MRKPRGASRGRIPASEESCARRAARKRGLVIRQHGDLGEVAFLHKATRLGLMVAKPYGSIYPFDFILQGGQKLWRIQIKSVAYVRKGLYSLRVQRNTGGGPVGYRKSEVDFVAVYIIPEETWYILPVRDVVERQCLQFRPTGHPRPDMYGHYREAWHLLREQDGLGSG